MKVLINLGKGFQQTRLFPKMILVLLGANLVLSLLLAVPLYRSLKDSFGASTVGERMALGFDYLWWEEYRDKNSGGQADTFTPALVGKGAVLINLEHLIQQSFWFLPPLLLAAGLLYIGLRTILSGGILFIFSTPSQGRFFLGDFLNGSARYALRFLGILLGGWLLLLITAAPLSGWLDSWVEGVARDASSEVTPFYLNLLSRMVILLLFLLIQIIMDYARISTVEHDLHNILHSLRAGFSYVARYPGAVLGLAGILWTMHIVWTVVYLLIRMLIPSGGFLGVAAAFILLQMFVAGLIWIRCWMYSSQLHLYRFLT